MAQEPERGTEGAGGPTYAQGPLSEMQPHLGFASPPVRPTKDVRNPSPPVAPVADPHRATSPTDPRLRRSASPRRGRASLATVLSIAATLFGIPFTARPALASTVLGEAVGGGFQNVVAIDPHGTGVVISGADVAGFQVGWGNGRRFSPKNAAATMEGDLD